jgi:nicotinic acid mononucleotide adenylyltransferase
LYTYKIKSESGESAPFYLLPDMEVEISASAIRDEMAKDAVVGTKEKSLLPDSVREYIRVHDLYRPQSLAPAST